MLVNTVVTHRFVLSIIRLVPYFGGGGNLMGKENVFLSCAEKKLDNG